MGRIWSAAGDADRTAVWLTLFQSRFPDSIAVSEGNASLHLRNDDPVAAKNVLDATEETPVYRFDRSVRIGGVCLILADVPCLQEHATRMTAWLDEDEQSGQAFGPIKRYRMAAEIFSNAAVPIASRDTDKIQLLLDDSDGWPITGGRATRYTGYLRVMLLSLLGNDSEAVAELQSTLSISNDGFLHRDIFRLPPDLNPLITRLDGTPGYTQWLTQYSGRREQARGRLIQLERNGEIIAASEVVL